MKLFPRNKNKENKEHLIDLMMTFNREAHYHLAYELEIAYVIKYGEDRAFRKYKKRIQKNEYMER